MRVVRDWFVDKREFVDDTGKVMTERTKPHSGAKRALSDLFGCPWCMGMWVSYFVIVLYFAFPPARFLALILALAGAASALQIIMNGIGAKAELYRKENNLHN
jgi:energy-converting hydrogenase Eha subunit G